MCTPSARGWFTLTVTVRDALARQAQSNVTISVGPSPGPATGSFLSGSLFSDDVLVIGLAAWAIGILALALAVRHRRKS